MLVTCVCVMSLTNDDLIFHRFPISRKHDYHHSHNIGNFGTLGIMDFIYGTDKHWRAYKARRGWEQEGAKSKKVKKGK